MSIEKAERLVQSFTFEDHPIFSMKDSKSIVEVMTQEEVGRLIKGAELPPKGGDFSKYLSRIRVSWGNRVAGTYLMFCESSSDYHSSRFMLRTLDKTFKYLARPSLEACSDFSSQRTNS